MAPLALCAFLGGCSVTVDTLGLVGNDPTLYRGTSTGYMDMTGTIKMTSQDGTNRCTGNFQYVDSETGFGSLTCSDGRSARIHFTGLSMTKGYGSGMTSDGEQVSFVYGMEDDEAALYLRTAQSAGQGNGATGSGFFVTAEGDIITNAHVVHGCKSAITLRTADGDVATANITALNTDLDLAALRSSTHSAAIPRWAATGSYHPGDPLFIYRFPGGGQSASGLSSTSEPAGDGGGVATGKLTAVDGAGNDPHYLQMSTPIQQADIGSPVVDAAGDVVGIVADPLGRKLGGAASTGATSADSAAQNANTAIREDVARRFLATHGIDIGSSDAPAKAAPSAADMGAVLRNYVVQLSCTTVG
ncbi:MAG TPA: serine protease [Dongiaceae bacterium]|nr:serine protease [Dongiaceae bacterium]